MPPMGTCLDCTDAELEAAIRKMLPDGEARVQKMIATFAALALERNPALTSGSRRFAERPMALLRRRRRQLRYSSLAQIDARNVGSLQVAWT
jgi:glucose dehydrogenase